VSAFGAFRQRRVALLLALGFASGLPLLLTRETLGAWLASERIDVGTIGLFSLVALPYSLKPFWAPLLDRYTLPWLGHRRGWLLTTQVLLALAIAVMGLVDPRRAPAVLAAAALGVAFLSASQDTVTDAYRAELLPDAERAAGTATHVLGYRVAMIAAGAGALVLSDHVPWSVCYAFLGALMLAGVATTLRAPDPPPAAAPPPTVIEAVVRPLRDYFGRRGAIGFLGFIALYKLGDYLAATMIVPFLKQTGFSNSEIGTLQNALGLGASIVGVLAGGVLVPRLGLRRALLVFGTCQAATNLLYAALALFGKSRVLLGAAIAVDQLAGGMGTTAFGALLLSLSAPALAATQLAVFTSVSAVAGHVLSAWSGYAARALGWPLFFAGTTLVALPALILIAGLRPPDPVAGG
jgi:MFS transporter, PAT family, beta-lactamase induction signal transducer AmpG